MRGIQAETRQFEMSNDEVTRAGWNSIPTSSEAVIGFDDLLARTTPDARGGPQRVSNSATSPTNCRHELHLQQRYSLLREFLL